MPQKHCSVGVTFGNLTLHSSPGNSQCTSILQALKSPAVKKTTKQQPTEFCAIRQSPDFGSTVHFVRSTSSGTRGSTVFETQCDRRCICQATSRPKLNVSRPRSPFSYPGLPAALRCLLKWTFSSSRSVSPRHSPGPSPSCRDFVYFPKGDCSSALLHTLKQINK